MAVSSSAIVKSERSAIEQGRVIRFNKRGASLGLSINDTSALIEQIGAGFSFDALREFESYTGISIAILASIVGIPERTLARRKAASRLAPEESERLLRLANIFEKTVELFEGDVKGAVNWLTTPKKALNNQQPLFYSRTELGGREVENILGRLEHGVFP